MISTRPIIPVSLTTTPPGFGVATAEIEAGNSQGEIRRNARIEILGKFGYNTARTSAVHLTTITKFSRSAPDIDTTT